MVVYRMPDRVMVASLTGMSLDFVICYNCELFCCFCDVCSLVNIISANGCSSKLS